MRGAFIRALHLAFGFGVVASVVGAGVSLMRGPGDLDAVAARQEA